MAFAAATTLATPLAIPSAIPLAPAQPFGLGANPIEFAGPGGQHVALDPVRQYGVSFDQGQMKRAVMYAEHKLKTEIAEAHAALATPHVDMLPSALLLSARRSQGRPRSMQSRVLNVENKPSDKV